MSLPGPDCYYSCPNCAKELLQGSWLSFNNFGATYWTDGREQAPMMPGFNSVTRCSGCQTFFWLEDAECRMEKASSAGWSGPDDRVVMRIDKGGYLPFPLLSQVHNHNLRIMWLKSIYTRNEVFRTGSHEEQVALFRKQHLKMYPWARVYSPDEDDIYSPPDSNQDEYANKLNDTEFTTALLQGFAAGEREKGFRVLAWWRSNIRVHAQHNPPPRPPDEDFPKDASEIGTYFAVERWVRWQRSYESTRNRDWAQADQVREENMRALLPMLEGDDDPNSVLMRAELYRNLGEFESCIKLAATMKGADIALARDKIIELAQAGDRVVAVYGQDQGW
jgi:hypothetical protein